MSAMILYHCPIACSQVSVCAAEEAGVDYELRLIDVAAGEQSAPGYAAISAMARIPVLQVGDAVITENAAILVYIDAIAGNGRLFPPGDSPLALARRQSGLSFCGATLHPIVRGIFAPGRFTDGETTPVRSRALALAGTAFAYAEAQFDRRGGWWLGPWSIIDVYLNWAVTTARNGGYDFAPYPGLASLERRLADRPSFVRMLAIEAESKEVLNARRAAA